MDGAPTEILIFQQWLTSAIYLSLSLSDFRTSARLGIEISELQEKLDCAKIHCQSWKKPQLQGPAVLLRSNYKSEGFLLFCELLQSLDIRIRQI